MTEVKVSGEAQKTLSQMIRQWSGWRDARLVLGETRPDVSPFAMTEFDTHTFTIDPEPLVLNPNRVLNQVTPFRLRQEAVLTGVMMHEAGHARHSLWLPRNEAERATFKHGNGDEVTPQVVSLARCAEEARIEGLMSRDARDIGALGLDWTMRAASARLLPMTDVSEDPAQAVLDVIQSWILRAGRVTAIQHWTGQEKPRWAFDFTNFLNRVLVDHFDWLDDAHNKALTVIDYLTWMVLEGDDTGPSMIDMARDLLRLLFPETDDEDMPQMGDSCSGSGDSADETGAGGAQRAEQADDEGSGQGEADKPEDGDSEGQGGGLSAKMMQDLADVEAAAQVEVEASQETKKNPPTGGGAGGQGTETYSGGWRDPSKAERETGKRAENFLRKMIDPSEAAKVVLSDSPGSNIDGAALSAWKAGGQHGDPMFFRRTNRAVEPAPPVKIAVLVDISSSMSELQKPSALLSWALATAAFDMRNFAGRGRQIESCLIHWGNDATVIQRNGEQLPGIREVPCNHGTRAMDEALRLVEEEIPGFFSEKAEPENRLLVQFTDWELFGVGRVEEPLRKALEVGVNMLTVAPSGWGRGHSMGGMMYQKIIGNGVQRGKATVMNYDERHPEKVWDSAADLLKR